MRKISIITSVYNRKDTILDTLRSVQSQDYINIEHIIVDANSNDGTSELILKNKKNNVIYLNEPDKGIYDGINKGIKLATGDIVGLLHSDDIFFSENIISTIQPYFDKFDLVYGDCNFYDYSLSKITRTWISSKASKFKLHTGWMPPHTSIFMKKNVFENIGFYNINYKISSDYDFILKSFLYEGHRSFYLNKVLVKMREGGVSSNNMKGFIQKLSEDIKITRNNSLFPLSALLKRIRKLNQLL
jgi:glycosyltransferase